MKCWTTKLLKKYNINSSPTIKDKTKNDRNIKLAILLENNGDLLSELFLNNKYRKADVVFKLTTKELNEHIKIKQSFEYFINAYFKDINPHLKKLAICYHNNRLNLSVVARQIGISTVSAICILYYIMTNTNVNIMVNHFKIAENREFINKLLIYYNKLPFHLRPGIKAINKYNIIFENNINLNFSNSTNTSCNIDYLYLDAFALYSESRLDQYLKNIFPRLIARNNTKIIITSQPNGNNVFQELSEKTDIWNVNILDYTTVASRDEAWSRVYKQLLGIESFLIEYCCAFPGTKKWNRLINLENLIKQ